MFSDSTGTICLKYEYVFNYKWILNVFKLVKIYSILDILGAGYSWEISWRTSDQNSRICKFWRGMYIVNFS